MRKHQKYDLLVEAVRKAIARIAESERQLAERASEHKPEERGCFSSGWREQELSSLRRALHETLVALGEESA